jgi:Cu(I)/Ag(I) efflux system membrane fusion protein
MVKFRPVGMKAMLVALSCLVALGGAGCRGKQTDSAKGAAGTKEQKEQYTCSMHPYIIKDEPGACSICNMTLVKKSSLGPSDRDVRALGPVVMSPAQQIVANLATAAVEEMPLTRSIVAPGTVTYNQARQGKVSAWVAGRVDRMLVNAVGQQARKDRPVAELYSADLKFAEEDYLLAYQAARQFANSPGNFYGKSSEEPYLAAWQRLRTLGFREKQFSQLEKGGKPTVRVPIVSPLSGTVLEKLVQEGQYVNVGDPLFSVADLSRVWVELDVQEDDFPFVAVGQMVTIESRAYPGESFIGQLTYVYPFMAPKSRTIRVRAEVDNPGLRLKPEMTVTARIMNALPPSLVVPVGAVMDTGKLQVVWVESKPGTFVPREVKTGARAGTLVQIRSGLQKGEKVAASGGYLVDSEAQMGAHDGLGQPSMPAAPPVSTPPAQTVAPGKPAKATKAAVPVSPDAGKKPSAHDEMKGMPGMEGMAGHEGMKGMDQR